MGLLPDNIAICDVVLAKLARKVLWSADTVLGLNLTQGGGDGSMKSMNVAKMVRCAHLALGKYGGGAPSTARDDFRSQEIQKNALDAA